MLHNTKIFFTRFGLFFSIASSAHPAMSAAVKDCKVSFKTRGQPVLVQIEGKSAEPCKGQLQGSNGKYTGSFTLSLLKLETGIPLRDRHLRENYLHTDKYPEANFTLVETSLTGGESGSFKGRLKLKETERDVTGTFKEGPGKRIEASFAIDLPNYGIERPSFMKVTVVDDVSITVELTHE